MASEQEIKQLVIERLKTLPENIGLSIGSMGDFDKQELISHVEQGDDIGQKIVEVELSFLRGLKEGILYES
ncbi:hypothetical protein A2482_04095 [Candidatus Falkowbacteria bacterium RIFOXYC2_FULL_48_21]|uniref:Uncharacterized protein n=1 Tax=Candidatus Falkowbacteria bacterium RIFOXYC2_FULL_48_21 TaxID=1798005 RepID=A0A1F5TH78_9BACT|nr:MAG: hypothetical protein A2482_04095 [Candidatus Falkowbacteria bacterium RIFOXYC2_FULL_48_21]